MNSINLVLQRTLELFLGRNINLVLKGIKIFPNITIDPFLGRNINLVMNSIKLVLNITIDPFLGRNINLVLSSIKIQGGARNIITLIVHITHFYYYKNI